MTLDPAFHFLEVRRRRWWGVEGVGFGEGHLFVVR